ncbi:outer membrane protein with beta-barrel domain [Algoriphagus boseongensis]|uniref:Outer membrane protein with beta-barrel domain n=1 Tax=Algoriphagus boseongensis TaxID=1442587 RepID=A0A4R6T337_9BACT|nr:outer membrane beta-barrel protein [Algoriphagus boseongensis]TDQ16584.1 outer membrane protein with beta-barrel domain [Algoriphagus boseongensis]
MKKYLLLICFMALVQVAFATDRHEFPVKTEMAVMKDSVVIEFGKAGKVVIIVESKEDFDKLKLMNINQIISELDLEENKETGELTIVEIRKKDGTVKEVVKVYEDTNQTEVNVAGMRLYVDESGENTRVKFETGAKKKQDPPFRTFFNIDLGVNNFLDADGKFPTSDQPYSVKGWGSWNVGLNWMAAQRISKGFYWDFGIGFQFYNFKFENRDYQAVRGEEMIDFIQRSDVDGFKSKLSSSYLTAMTMFELDFGKMNDNGRRGLRIAAGPYVGYRLGGQSKYVFRELEGSGRRKDKEDTGLYLENLRYGIRGELGVGRIKFFTTYDLNNLFQDGKGPELNPITFGIVF